MYLNKKNHIDLVHESYIIDFDFDNLNCKLATIY